MEYVPLIDWLIRFLIGFVIGVVIVKTFLRIKYGYWREW